MAAACMICALLRRRPTPSRLGVGCCRIWASCRSRSPGGNPHADEDATRPGSHPGTANRQPGAPPASAPDRACHQQRQALSHCERPDPPVEGGCPRSRDGALLCPAQFPGAPAPLAAHDLTGINSTVPVQARNLADEQVGETVPEPTWLYPRHTDAVRPLRTQGAHNIRTRGSLPHERSHIRTWLAIAHHHFSACRPRGVHIRIYDGIRLWW